MQVSGKVAVITGASRGLGAGMALEFQRLGLKLGLCSRSPPCLSTDGSSVVASQIDVRDADAMFSFAKLVTQQLGQIDLWINNSGTLEPVAPQRDLEAAALADHLAINVGGVLNGSRCFIRHLRSRGGEGVLINISSGAGRFGYAGWSAYCAGKAAVDRLTECVQLEEERVGLRAYSVAPGIVETGMQERIRSLSPDVFPTVDKFIKIKDEETYNTPDYVARSLLSMAFDPQCRPTSVVCSLSSTNHLSKI